jgi:hypothetical protein
VKDQLVSSMKGSEGVRLDSWVFLPRFVSACQRRLQERDSFRHVCANDDRLTEANEYDPISQRRFPAPRSRGALRHRQRQYSECVVCVPRLQLTPECKYVRPAPVTTSGSFLRSLTLQKSFHTNVALVRSVIQRRFTVLVLGIDVSSFLQ